MTYKKIDIKGDILFPMQFQFFAAALFVGSFFAMTQNIIVGVVLFIISLLIFTGRGGVQVNLIQKTYLVYNSFLFIKSGKEKSYNTLEKIFINAGEYQSKMYTPHTTASFTVRDVEYNAYLKLDNEVKLYLGCDKDKDKVLKRFNKIANKLKIPLQEGIVNE